MTIASILGTRFPAMDQDNLANLTSVRLTRKYAEVIDGVDLSRNKVGDRLDLSSRDARMLIAEGWAMPCPNEEKQTTGESAAKSSDEHPIQATASDSSRVRGA